MSGSPRLIYCAIKYHPDLRNRDLIETLDAALAVNGWEMRVIVRDIENWGQTAFSPQSLMAQSFRLIEACEALMAVLNEKGVGVGIEAGYAAALGKPVYVVAQEGADISATLAGIARKVLLYRDVDDLTGLFKTIN